jgi:hopanoid C-2 methylase
MKTSHRKRILIVNCYFDELRIPIRRPSKVPRQMTIAYLAGLFSPELCDVRLYDELYSGPLEDEKLLAFPDMLVLTGLNTAFDRMLHVTAYVRTKNSKDAAIAFLYGLFSDPTSRHHQRALIRPQFPMVKLGGHMECTC